MLKLFEIKDWGKQGFTTSNNNNNVFKQQYDGVGTGNKMISFFENWTGRIGTTESSSTFSFFISSLNRNIKSNLKNKLVSFKSRFPMTK